MQAKSSQRVEAQNSALSTRVKQSYESRDTEQVSFYKLHRRRPMNSDESPAMQRACEDLQRRFVSIAAVRLYGELPQEALPQACDSRKRKAAGC